MTNPNVAGATSGIDPGPPQTRTALIWFGALMIALLGWVYASPVGGSPDEPAHMAYAWGLLTGQDVLNTPPNCDATLANCAIYVDVPVGLIPDPTCYQRLPETSAGCEGEPWIGSQPTRTFRYPPPYYLLVGATMRASTGLGVSGETAGIVGRIAGSLVVASILVPAFVLASKHARNLIPFLVVCLTPMTMFVAGSINPNGVEIAGAMAAATALVVMARSMGHSARGSTTERVPISVIATFAYGIGWLAWGRPLGFLWAGGLLLFGFLYIRHSYETAAQGSSDWKELARVVRPAFAPAGAVTGLAVAWFGYSILGWGTSSSSTKTLPDPGIESLVAVLLRWGGILWEGIGILGWLYTPLPVLVMVISIGCIAAMMAAVSVTNPGQAELRKVAWNFLVVMALGITTLMFITTFLWQGRYVLPTMVAFLILWGGTAVPAG